MTEQELVQAFVKANPFDGQVYFEVHKGFHYYQRTFIDIVIVTKSDILIGVEAKLRVNDILKAQLERDKAFCHLVYALLPENKATTRFKTWCKEHGIGCITYDQKKKQITHILYAQIQHPILHGIVRDNIKRGRYSKKPAGTNRVALISDITERIAEILRKSDEPLTIGEIQKALEEEGHYYSYKTVAKFIRQSKKFKKKKKGRVSYWSLRR